MADSLRPVSTITTVRDTTCSPFTFQMGLAWQLYDSTHSNIGAPWAFKNGGNAGSTAGPWRTISPL